MTDELRELVSRNLTAEAWYMAARIETPNTGGKEGLVAIKLADWLAAVAHELNSIPQHGG